MIEIDDIELLTMVSERMANYDSSKLIPEKELYEQLGISEEDLLDFEDIELE